MENNSLFLVMEFKERNMPFELVAHDVLKTGLKESIKTLVVGHKPNELVDSARLEGAVEFLNQPRKSQAQFLIKIIGLTDRIEVSSIDSIQTKARILNAAAFYIREKIEVEYSGMFSRLSGPQNSLLYGLLGSSLKLTEENKPTETDTVELYKELKTFLLKQVYTNGNVTKGYLDVHPFKEISNYKVEDDLRYLTRRISSIEESQLRAAKKLHDQAERPQVAVSAFNLFRNVEPVNLPVIDATQARLPK